MFIVTFIFIANFSLSAAAANIVEKKYKVDVKCHVELVGGQQVIYFARVKQNQVNKLVDTLVNRNIPTSIAKEQQKVYRAFECVLLDAKFNSLKANQLFDSQAR